MEENEILDQLNTIFRQIFENENIVIKAETTADDVEEWDSFNHTTIIAEIEKHFKIQFKLKEMLGFKNVGDMIRTIQAKLKGA